MELDEFKITIRKSSATFSQKAFPELEAFMRGKTQSTLDRIKTNIKLEIVFALLFLLFDLYILLISNYTYLKTFAFLILVFCIFFIYYLYSLLKHVQSVYIMVIPVKQQLKQYIGILQRFIRLYFQLTSIMVPLIFIMVFLSGYVNQYVQSSNLMNAFTLQRIRTYILLSVIWSAMMYFFSKWYIKKLYGDQLNSLRQQLEELEGESNL